MQKFLKCLDYTILLLLTFFKLFTYLFNNTLNINIKFILSALIHDWCPIYEWINLIKHISMLFLQYYRMTEKFWCSNFLSFNFIIYEVDTLSSNFFLVNMLNCVLFTLLNYLIFGVINSLILTDRLRNVIYWIDNDI
jgi:hypothetical protein